MENVYYSAYKPTVNWISLVLRKKYMQSSTVQMESKYFQILSFQTELTGCMSFQELQENWLNFQFSKTDFRGFILMISVVDIDYTMSSY